MENKIKEYGKQKTNAFRAQPWALIRLDFYLLVSFVLLERHRRELLLLPWGQKISDDLGGRWAVCVLTWYTTAPPPHTAMEK